VALVLAATVLAAAALRAQTRSESSGVSLQQVAGRNPAFLNASEILPRRDPAEARRVRFEWEHVGAVEYVLQGQWVEPVTWAARKREVVLKNDGATRWDERLIALELELQPGAHSWSVVAVFPGKGLGDFAHPTRLSFEVK
jgi:hypothetical protein